jgi:cation transport regulator
LIAINARSACLFLNILMPYATSQDLPASIRRTLPPHAQEIFRASFNAAWRTYGQKDPAHREEIAHRVAWAAVKKRYRKVGNAWLPLEA